MQEQSSGPRCGPRPPRARGSLAQHPAAGLGRAASTRRPVASLSQSRPGAGQQAGPRSCTGRTCSHTKLPSSHPSSPPWWGDTRLACTPAPPLGSCFSSARGGRATVLWQRPTNRSSLSRVGRRPGLKAQAPGHGVTWQEAVPAPPSSHQGSSSVSGSQDSASNPCARSAPTAFLTRRDVAARAHQPAGHVMRDRNSLGGPRHPLLPLQTPRAWPGLTMSALCFWLPSSSSACDS